MEITLQFQCRSKDEVVTPLLEAIEIGDSKISDNFFFASSLKLERGFQLWEWWIDLPKLRSLSFGGGAFCCCSHVVMESALWRKEMMNRFAGIGNHSARQGCTSIQPERYILLDYAKYGLYSFWTPDLPKLTTLTTEEESTTFSCPHHVILEGDCSTVVLLNRYAFPRTSLSPQSIH